MNVVDSSAWLAYLSGEKNANIFAAPIEDTDLLLVPSICIYEVFKVVMRERDEDTALAVAASMEQGQIIDLDAELAMEAAALGLEENLALADSIIYRIAQKYNALLWTQDDHFSGKKNVRFRKK